jgi:hypothetical protein
MSLQAHCAMHVVWAVHTGAPCEEQCAGRPSAPGNLSRAESERAGGPRAVPWDGARARAIGALGGCGVVSWTRRFVCVAALGLAISACGTGHDGAPDAGIGEGGCEVPGVITGPGAPRAVALACRSGWRSVSVHAAASGEEITACEPWAGDDAPTCAPEEAAIPGQGCVRIGSECPADGWPADLPASGVIYVRAGATGGDGTRALPFGTLAEGLEAGRGRDVIVALAAGEYEGGVEMRTGEIRGACASGTIVRDLRTEPMTAGIFVWTAGARLRDLTVIGGRHGVWLPQRATATAIGVRLVGEVDGLRLDSDASFEGENVEVIGALGAIAPSPTATAIATYPRSSLVLRGASVRGGPSASIASFFTADALASAVIELEDVSLQGSTGDGIAGGFGTIALRGVVIDGGRRGLGVPPGGTADVEDVLVRDLSGVGDDVLGIRADGTLRGARVRVARIAGGGLHAQDALGAVELTDVVVEDAAGGASVSVAGGASMHLEGLVVLRAGASGVSLTGLDTTATIHDAWVAGTTLTPTGGEGFGVVDGATLTLERADARDVARAVLFAAGRGARIDASDVTAEGAGYGAYAQCAASAGVTCVAGDGASLSLRRARLRALRGLGVGAVGATLALEDVAIEDVSQGSVEGTGWGLAANEGGVVTGSRVSIVRAERWGVLVYGEGSRVDLSGLEVRDTVSSSCECVSASPGGDGIACAEQGSLALRGFAISGSENAGLFLAQACASPELACGVVSGNGFGVLTEGASGTDGRFSQVDVASNATDFQSTTLRIERPRL